jgi:acetolactate synthase small subunit
MKGHYVLTVRATDRPGLIHSITGMINRRLIPIISLSAAPTDVHDIVLITIEVQIAGNVLGSLMRKVGSIVEVFSVDVIKYETAICRRTAFFKMDKAVLSSTLSSVISKWEAQIINININSDTLLIAKSGNEMIIQQLYNELEGPLLLGFSQTGLIVDSRLIEGDESSVISLLAA